MSVRWVNDAEIFHTVTPDDPAQPGAWPATSTSRRGTVLIHVFTQPGRTYAYHCEPHRGLGMTGVIRVRLNPQSVRR
ncbi:MAG: hypothetical protein K6U07_08990 [Firmicutes bacterium]|nr:hypothetical protein [Bacillota bacterium]